MSACNEPLHRGSVSRVGMVPSVSVGGFESGGIHSLCNDFGFFQGVGHLHGHKRTDVVFEASGVVIHARGGIHVQEFQHDGSEFVIIGVDGGLLGEALESIVCTDGGVDWCEVSANSFKELFPGWGIDCPVGVSVIGPPPESCLVFEKRASKGNSVIMRYWQQFAVLLHLEDPAFQGFGLFATKW